MKQRKLALPMAICIAALLGVAAARADDQAPVDKSKTERATSDKTQVDRATIDRSQIIGKRRHRPQLVWQARPHRMRPAKLLKPPP